MIFRIVKYSHRSKQKMLFNEMIFKRETVRDQVPVSLYIVWNCDYVQYLRGRLTFNLALAAEIYDHLMVLVLHISAQMFSQLKLMVPSPSIYFLIRFVYLLRCLKFPGFSLYIYIPCHTFLKSLQSTREFVRCATFCILSSVR
jgi:hypothetical protein